MSVIRNILVGKNLNRKILNSISAFRKNYSNSSEFILHSDLPDIETPKVSVDEFMFLNTHKWPHLVATECAITGRKYTHEEIRNKATNLSRALRKKLKLQKGDVVAVLLANCPEFIMVTIGALKAGLIVTTLNPVYTPDEISRQLKDSSTKAIITLADFHQLAKASANLTNTPIDILTIRTQQGQSTPEGALNLDEFTENIDYPDLPPASTDDVAFLPYSSGTTGLPKGVELTHYNIMANLVQFNAKELAIIQDTTKDHQDVIPAVLPKFHIYGLTATTLHLYQKGCKTVSIPKFTPDVYINTLKKHQPDVLFVAPPLVLFLTGHPSVTKEDLSPIRSLISGAAPLGRLDEDKFLQKAQKDINIVQGYGLTETSPMVTITRPDIRKIPTSSGSIGRPVPSTSVKVVNPEDPNGTPLGPNQTGELLVKGPQVMKGYHKRPEQTKEVFTEDGWFRTGDMMHYNDDKLLFVSDRLKELIKVKGFQVPPAELEEIIRHFPDIEDAAVIGIPHPNHGEVPRAYIVQKAGKNVDVEKLNDYVSTKVAPYKQLRGGIEIIDTIPKNASGKIMRRSLKEHFAQNEKK